MSHRLGRRGCADRSHLPLESLDPPDQRRVGRAALITQTLPLMVTTPQRVYVPIATR